MSEYRAKLREALARLRKRTYKTIEAAVGKTPDPYDQCVCGVSGVDLFNDMDLWIAYSEDCRTEFPVARTRFGSWRAGSYPGQVVNANKLTSARMEGCGRVTYFALFKSPSGDDQLFDWSRLFVPLVGHHSDVIEWAPGALRIPGEIVQHMMNYHA